MTNTELAKLIDRRNTLYARIDALTTISTVIAGPTLKDIKLEYAEELTRLDKLISEKREYMYNFVGGGWNTEYALTVEEAIKQAKARWGDDPKLQVDEKTFHVTNEKELRSAYSLFY